MTILGSVRKWNQSISQYSDEYYDRVKDRAYLHSVRYPEVGQPHISEGRELIQEAIRKTRSDRGSFNQLIQEQRKREQSKISFLFKMIGLNPSGDVENDIRRLNQEYIEKLPIRAKVGNGEINQMVRDLINEKIPNEAVQVDENGMAILEGFAQNLEEFILHPARFLVNRSLSEIDIEDARIALLPVLRNLRDVIQRRKGQKLFEYTQFNYETIQQFLSGELTESDLKAIGAKRKGKEKTLGRNLMEIRYSLLNSTTGLQSYMSGQRLENQLISMAENSGELDFIGESVANSMSNALSNLVPNAEVTLGTSSSGRPLHGRVLHSKYQKDIKVDVSWRIKDLVTSEEEQINMSVKVWKGTGSLEIHSGGGIDSYVERMGDHSYTKHIAELFKNNNFRYFLANEFFMMGLGENPDRSFRRDFEKLIKYGAYAFIGQEGDLNGIREALELGQDDVDFLFLNNKIIPVSALLEKLYNGSDIIRGVSLNLKFGKSNLFLDRKREAIYNVYNAPTKDPEYWYMDDDLLSAGQELSDQYINNVKYTISIMRRVVSELNTAF